MNLSIDATNHMVSVTMCNDDSSIVSSVVVKHSISDLELPFEIRLSHLKEVYLFKIKKVTMLQETHMNLLTIDIYRIRNMFNVDLGVIEDQKLIEENREVFCM